MNLFKQIIIALTAWLTRASEPKEAVLCDFDRIKQSAKPGDVLLIEGRSSVDGTIKKLTQSHWSHGALYIGRLIDIDDMALRELVRSHIDCDTDTPLIVHSVLGQGTIIEPLQELEREHIRLCRPKGLAKGDVQQVIRYMLSQVATDREEYHFMDIMRFFFPWSLVPQRWRMPLLRYNYGKHVELVSCSVIANAFGFVQFPIMPLVKTTRNGGTQLLRRKPRLCMPVDFDVSPYFEIVKYPFIDFANYTGHNLIPWKGSGVLSGEEPNLQIAHYNQAAIGNQAVMSQKNNQASAGKKKPGGLGEPPGQDQ